MIDWQEIPLMVHAERKSMALDVVAEHAGEFREDFPLWLDENFHIWMRFEEMSLEVSAKRAYYSAYTIWEVLRHHSLMRETSSKWKLNNDFRPDCARLFALLHPKLKDFFSTRRRTAALMEEVE